MFRLISTATTQLKSELVEGSETSYGNLAISTSLHIKILKPNIRVIVNMK